MDFIYGLMLVYGAAFIILGLLMVTFIKQQDRYITLFNHLTGELEKATARTSALLQDQARVEEQLVRLEKALDDLEEQSKKEESPFEHMDGADILHFWDMFLDTLADGLAPDKRVELARYLSRCFAELRDEEPASDFKRPLMVDDLLSTRLVTEWSDDHDIRKYVREGLNYEPPPRNIFAPPGFKPD